MAEHRGREAEEGEMSNEEEKMRNEEGEMRNEEEQRATIFTSSPGSDLAWQWCSWPPTVFHSHLFLEFGWQQLVEFPTCFSTVLGN